MENNKDDIINTNNKDKETNEISLDILDNKDILIQEIRIAVIGNVDSGKSTLVGVLSNSILDDGRGSARQLVLNYKHEKDNGRTSSISQQIMCFTDSKQLLPTKDKKRDKYSQIIPQCDKIITLLDLCGYEKYFKTTLFGLTLFKPDYTIIVIGANMGIQRMTKEHLGIALALRNPLILVITKIDITPEEIYQQTLKFVIKILKSNGAQRNPIEVNKGDNINSLTDSITKGNLCPIFCVSNVTGNGIPELKQFLSLIKKTSVLYQTDYNMSSIEKPMTSSTMMNRIKNTTEFWIQKHKIVNNVGLVVNGLCVLGKVSVGQYLSIGPDLKGDFKPVVVKSIHYKQSIVNNLSEGQIGCLCIKSLDDKEFAIKKGTILVDRDYLPLCANEFEAEIVILHYSTTIKVKSKAVIHCGHVRQSASVMSLNSELLKSGERGIVKFKFINNPEYLHLGSVIILRDGNVRGLGRITTIFN